MLRLRQRLRPARNKFRDYRKKAMLLVICALTNVAAIANFVGTYLGYKWCQEYSAAL